MRIVSANVNGIRAAGAHVGRAPTYAERWSDHAPVVVDHDL